MVPMAQHFLLSTTSPDRIFSAMPRRAAWREDLRRVSNGEQVYGVVGLAMRCKPSVDFCGYWQRAQAA
jgi:hypothetical protein